VDDLLKPENKAINDATVTTVDVVASNGVIHVIDSVLLPPSS
jgi:transforming growth factor-beta-induced protein